ncbi:MAG: amidohydrolase family protein [Armatimonadetes bacterium]|nr:amidohydrolase family protein [Armatimonadota bacterium]
MEKPTTDRPYDPDVSRRDTEDGGYSRGWGFHMIPSERYWIDCHTHFRFGSADEGHAGLVRWFDRLEAWRLGQIVAMDGSPSNLEMYAEVGHDPRLIWLLWLKFDQPDLDACKRAFDLGCGGLKLHNAAVITSGSDYHVWENDDWAKVFEEVNRQKKPILWHVTQRMTASAYNGGGFQAYWSEGWKKGVTYTNEDLLQQQLRLMAAYRDIPFIGAHQHYLGLERLTEVFDAHPNFYIDTSVGGIVRWGDEMYPEDQAVWREFVIRYADRILFGTDSGVGSWGSTFELNVQAFLNHVRFVHQLRLPDEVLQKVTSANAARLFNQKERPSSRRTSVRP